MEYSKNPFTPTFGSVPPFLAGREHILRDINRGFINGPGDPNLSTIDRKSTRLNSSHTVISYSVFCLKKKKNKR